MTNDYAYALDLGTTKVVCIAACRDGQGRLRAEAFASAPCQGVVKGLVADPVATGRAIDAAVARVERAIGRPVEGLAVTVGGAQLQSVNSQGFLPIVPKTRSVRRDDVLQVVNASRQIVLPPDREQLTAIPRVFHLEGRRGLADPVGRPGGRLEVVTHIVTAQSGAIQAVDRALTEAGRRVAEMVAEPIASALGVIDLDRTTGDVVVVDLGGSATGIAAFVAGSVAYTAVVPVGGQHVTADLAHLLRVDSTEAERLKVAHGSATAASVPETEAVEVVQEGAKEARPLQRRVLCEIVEARLREVAELVSRHLGLCGLGDRELARIVLTGGASQTPQIAELFRGQTGVGEVVRRGPQVVGPHARSLEDPGMSAAVGLARYVLEGDDQELASVSGPASWRERIRTLRAVFTRG